MRIISGFLKGRKISPPSRIKARPTTDFAKEGLFNALEARFRIEGATVVDLCCGTGNISLEFVSRGAAQVYGIDISTDSQQFINSLIKQHALEEKMKFIRADIWRMAKNLKEQADFIFADPPFTLKDYTRIHDLVFSNQLLKPGGVLIIEHPKTAKLESLLHFDSMKHYGSIYFSFFIQD